MRDADHTHEIALHVPTVTECSDLLSVSDLLKNHFQSECLEGYICNSCSTYSTSVSSLGASKFPSEVILVLKRSSFNHEALKNTRTISIDERITIKEATFVLHSVVCHHGERPTEGHYT